MPKKLEVVGQRFGRLVVTAAAGQTAHKKTLWLCQCDCGGTITTIGASLRNGRTQGCGCIQKEIAKENCAKLGRKSRTHGMTRSPLHRAWTNMLMRCYNPRNPEYHNYGGRGISVCDEWRKSFEAFASHVGPKPEGRSIDRINVNGNYEPGNVRWATPKEQSENRRCCAKYRNLEAQDNECDSRNRNS